MKLRSVLQTLISILILTMAGCCSNQSLPKISREEILDAQSKWAQEIVNIGKSYTEKKDYKEVAQNLLNNLYAFNSGTVLFKPTKVAENQFRNTEEGALSYFVGGSKSFSEDKGFALQPWIKVRFENSDIIINDEVGVAMGNYFFTPLKGKDVKVEYTFGYLKKNDSSIKIFLHHSSLPYDG